VEVETMGKLKAFYHEEISQQTEDEMGPQPDLPQVFILWCSEYPDTERHVMGVYPDEASAQLDRLLYMTGDTSAAYDGRFKYEVQGYEVMQAYDAMRAA
jgi:hypothetical protein